MNIPHTGYVGVEIVKSASQITKDIRFVTNDGEKSFSKLQVEANYLYSPDDEDKAEYVVKIHWLKTVSEKEAIKELVFFGNQNSVCRPM